KHISMIRISLKKRLDGELMLTGLKAQSCCQGLLHIHREQIIFAPMTVMQGVPYAKEKVQRRFHRLLVTGSHEPLRNQIGDGAGLVEGRADPQSCVVIT